MISFLILIYLSCWFIESNVKISTSNSWKDEESICCTSLLSMRREIRLRFWMCLMYNQPSDQKKKRKKDVCLCNEMNKSLGAATNTPPQWWPDSDLHCHSSCGKVRQTNASVACLRLQVTAPCSLMAVLASSVGDTLPSLLTSPCTNPEQRKQANEETVEQTNQNLFIWVYS